MVDYEHLGKTLVLTAEVMTPDGIIKDYAKLTVK
jgi:hypothetical protein